MPVDRAISTIGYKSSLPRGTQQKNVGENRIAKQLFGEGICVDDGEILWADDVTNCIESFVGIEVCIAVANKVACRHFG